MVQESPSDSPRPPAEAHRLGGGAIASLTGLGLLLIFMIQNTERVRLDFLFWKFTWPLWLLTIDQRTAWRRRRLGHLVCPHSLPCQRADGGGAIDGAGAPADSCTSPTLLMAGSLPGAAAGAMPDAR
jgi:hypothetical protein